MPVTDVASVSPGLKPLYWTVKAGFAAPYVFDLSSAVTVSGALVIVRFAPTNVIA